MTYYVYILRCADGTYYTGITNDLTKRVDAHNSPFGGAKYTRGRQPVRLVYKKRHPNKSKALKHEIKIKALSRKEKEKTLIYT